MAACSRTARARTRTTTSRPRTRSSSPSCTRRASSAVAEVALRDDDIAVGERFSVAFQRTLRVPADGKTYPLPPALGRLPVTAVETLGQRAPAFLRERGDLLIPLHQREALWLAFDGAPWKPNAVQVGVGEVNALSGERWEVGLRAEPQNYLVCPDQLWLDGINAGEGVVRQ